MRRLLDTNAYTHLRRGAGEVADHVRNAREIVMSTIVRGEVLYGFRHGSRTAPNETSLGDFLAMPRVTVMPVSEATADRYSRICALLRRKGTPIPSNDVWIAAHGMEAGAVLLSFDAHFEVVDGLALKLLTLGRVDEVALIAASPHVVEGRLELPGELAQPPSAAWRLVPGPAASTADSLDTVEGISNAMGRLPTDCSACSGLDHLKSSARQLELFRLQAFGLAEREVDADDRWRRDAQAR